MKGSCKLPGKQKLDCGKPSLLSPQSLHLIELEVHVLSHASFELATQFYKTKQPEPCSLFLTSKSAWTTFGSWRQIRAEEMSSLLRNIKNLRFYPSCKLTRYPDVNSWVLTGDTRLLSHKERLIAHSHSSSQSTNTCAGSQDKKAAWSCIHSGLRYRSRPLPLPAQLRKLKYFIMDRKHTWHQAVERPFVTLDK